MINKNMDFPKEFCGCRIEIKADGVTIMGFSVPNRPGNDVEMIEILEEVISALKAPKIETDTDL